MMSFLAFNLDCHCSHVGAGFAVLTTAVEVLTTAVEVLLMAGPRTMASAEFIGARTLHAIAVRRRPLSKQPHGDGNDDADGGDDDGDDAGDDDRSVMMMVTMNVHAYIYIQPKSTVRTHGEDARPLDLPNWTSLDVESGQELTEEAGMQGRPC